MKRYLIVHFQLVIILSLCSIYAVWVLDHSTFKPYSFQSYTVHLNQQHLSKLTCTEAKINSEQESILSNEQLSQELLAVFDNDSLWARTLQLPFSNDINLGSNSDSDVYVQFLAKKQWVLRHDISIDTQQLFRYGSSSKNYSETTFNLNQKLQDNTLFSNQFSLNKSQDEEYYWANRTFQQYQFLKNYRLIYGIYSSGVYDQTKKDWELQLWGPYLSWRRPLWRDWIFIDNQISYYHDMTTTDKELQHIFSTTIQLEANF